MIRILAILATLTLSSWTTVQAAEPHLASLFSDHMVLQRDRPVPIWGQADPGATITVAFAGQTKTATAGPGGRWQVLLDAMPASAEGRTLLVNAKGISDVLVGEVWLASGQSNMVYQLHPVHDAAAIAASDHADVRIFTEESQGSLTPQITTKGRWQVSSPQAATGISAVGYYFADELRRELHVPIGLLVSCVGGTQAESWLSREAQAASPVLAPYAEKQISTMASFDEDAKRFQEELPKWEVAHGAVDTGNTGVAKGWAKEDFDDSSWAVHQAPVFWRDFGWKGGGVMWLRKTLDVPADQAGKFANVGFGGYGEDVTVYFNGQELQPSWARPARFFNWWAYFNVPAGVVKAGRNVLALRVHSLTENGLVWPQPKDIVGFADQATTDNTWRTNEEVRFPDLTPEARATLPTAPDARIENTASALFNGKIHPLIPYAMRGVIWYQGESNANRGSTYAPLLAALVGDWRARWGAGDFPFCIVQLANYDPAAKEPGASGVAEVREGQLQVAQRLPDCGLAVAIDIGEVNIHPINKRDVGHRLALHALATAYGRPLPCWGPTYRSMAVEGQTIRLRFDHLEGGLVAKGGPLQRFAIAGADQKFHWASATIAGDSVIVSDSQVTAPAAVRYAWANNPDGCNLYNRAGLPASPFRTDSWPH